MKFYRIVLPYACYGIKVRNNIIISAAPIANWVIGKTIEFFKVWIQKKGGSIKELFINVHL